MKIPLLILQIRYIYNSLLFKYFKTEKKNTRTRAFSNLVYVGFKNGFMASSCASRLNKQQNFFIKKCSIRFSMEKINNPKLCKRADINTFSFFSGNAFLLYNEVRGKCIFAS